MCTPVSSRCNIKCLLPYLNAGLQTGVIMAVGDLIAQSYLEDKGFDFDKLDFRRTAKFTAVGLLYAGPVLTFWQQIMRGYLPRRAPALEKAITKTITTQIYLTPAVCGGIVGLCGTLKDEKLSIEAMQRNIESNFFKITGNAYAFWPIIQLVSNVLSPAIKSGIICVASIMWSSYLSTVLLGKDKPPELPPKPTKKK